MTAITHQRSDNVAKAVELMEQYLTACPDQAVRVVLALLRGYTDSMSVTEQRRYIQMLQERNQKLGLPS
jgi:hypothetical protein